MQGWEDEEGFYGGGGLMRGWVVGEGGRGVGRGTYVHHARLSPGRFPLVAWGGLSAARGSARRCRGAG